MNILNWLLDRRPSENPTGLIFNPEQDNDPRNLRFEDIMPLSGMGELPESGDVEKEHWTLNQQSSTSCTCHSTVHKLNQVLGKHLSPRYAFKKIKADPKYPSSQLPHGAYMVDSLKLQVNEGICGIEYCPNEAQSSDENYLRFEPSAQAERDAALNKGGSYIFTTSGADDLAKFDSIRSYMALTGRSCKVGIVWRTSFNLARKGGIVPASIASGNSAGHDMMAVAWKKIDGHEYIGFRNSWGETWGDKGRIWLPKGFFKIQSGMDYLPPESTAKIEIKKPTAVVLERDYNLEKSVADNLRKAIYKEFPLDVPGDAGRKNFDARSLMGRMWLELPMAVCYRHWTNTDIVNFLYARSRNMVNSPAYSLDFNKERYV